MEAKKSTSGRTGGKRKSGTTVGGKPKKISRPDLKAIARGRIFKNIAIRILDKEKEQQSVEPEPNQNETVADVEK